MNVADTAAEAAELISACLGAMRTVGYVAALKALIEDVTAPPTNLSAAIKWILKRLADTVTGPADKKIIDQAVEAALDASISGGPVSRDKRAEAMQRFAKQVGNLEKEVISPP